MARVSTYLNFPRNTEQAFNFYRSAFGGEFTGGIHRFTEIPASPDHPKLAEADKKLEQVRETLGACETLYRKLLADSGRPAASPPSSKASKA